MKGDPGADGAMGPQGQEGSLGQMGEPGQPGENGVLGEKGKMSHLQLGASIITVGYLITCFTPGQHVFEAVHSGAMGSTHGFDSWPGVCLVSL